MIIDSFMFNDELDLLELRLGQLDDVVDYFVFNEIPSTHSGKLKPLYYQENKHLFSKWNHKIICTSPALPPQGAWALETAQRKALETSVLSLNPKPEDILSTSDCDEIPNPEVLKNYTPDLGLRNLKQFTFWYNFNKLFDYGSRTSSRARLGTIQNMYDAGGLGNFHGGPKDDMDPNFPSIENAGWHCSYFGSSIERIRKKVNSFAHEDLVHIINGRTDKQIAEDMHNGACIYHLAGVGTAEHVSSDDPIRVPPYFRRNQERFSLFTDAFFCEKYKDLLNSPETGYTVPIPPRTPPVPEWEKVDKSRLKRH
jgi:beta-1,4-mannosyl-glycoprotein beta-1,4-N-acetylglucosaminyltransferase